VTGFSPNTTYFVRAYATNINGTNYGEQVSFRTQSNLTGTLTDVRDGKIYKTVKIGDQWWMAENLAWLPAVSSPTSGSTFENYYYVYGYQGNSVAEAKATANFITYGVLYNWTAAMNGSMSSSANPSGVQGPCPAGWHLPSQAEWIVLSDYLIVNGYGYGGSGDDIAKSLSSKTNWNTSSIPGTPGNDPTSNNSCGFSALPGGIRGDGGGVNRWATMVIGGHRKCIVIPVLTLFL